MKRIVLLRSIHAEITVAENNAANSTAESTAAESTVAESTAAETTAEASTAAESATADTTAAGSTAAGSTAAQSTAESILEIHRRARTVPNLGIFNDFHSSVQLNTIQCSSISAEDFSRWFEQRISAET